MPTCYVGISIVLFPCHREYDIVPLGTIGIIVPRTMPLEITVRTVVDDDAAAAALEEGPEAGERRRGGRGGGESAVVRGAAAAPTVVAGGGHRDGAEGRRCRCRCFITMVLTLPYH